MTLVSLSPPASEIAQMRDAGRRLLAALDAAKAAAEFLAAMGGGE